MLVEDLEFVVSRNHRLGVNTRHPSEADEDGLVLRGGDCSSRGVLSLLLTGIVDSILTCADDGVCSVLHDTLVLVFKLGISNLGLRVKQCAQIRHENLRYRQTSAGCHPTSANSEPGL